LYTQLSSTVTVVGIDEHTALIFDFTTGQCSVSGRGEVTIVRLGHEQRFKAGDKFLFQVLGPYQVPDLQIGISPEIWEQVRESSAPASNSRQPPAAILTLAHQRQEARQCRNWVLADKLRNEIETLGWKISDTANGLLLEPSHPEV
jgi:cysteinyl-tRNA synthetase